MEISRVGLLGHSVKNQWRLFRLCHPACIPTTFGVVQCVSWPVNFSHFNRSVVTSLCSLDVHFPGDRQWGCRHFLDLFTTGVFSVLNAYSVFPCLFNYILLYYWLTKVLSIFSVLVLYLISAANGFYQCLVFSSGFHFFLYFLFVISSFSLLNYKLL